MNNWGDVICSLGRFQQEVGHGGAVYVGHVAELPEFLASQAFVEEVRHVPFGALADHRATLDAAVRQTLGPAQIEEIARAAGVPAQGLGSSYIDHRTDELWSRDVPIARGLGLPPHCVEWAGELVRHLPRPLYLVQPFSVNTSQPEEHWPFWRMLMRWMFSDRAAHFLLCGRGWDDSRSAGLSNVTRLVGKTPSQAHVFALAERAAAVITTSNSLAHYCACQRIPQLVACVNVNSQPNSFFHKQLLGPDTTLMSRHASLARVAYALRERFGIWPREGDAATSVQAPHA